MAVQTQGHLGKFHTLIEQVRAAKQKAVYVGVPAEQNPAVNDSIENDSTAFNLASLAAVLEFGNHRIPSRPFLRQTLAQHQAKYVQMFADGLAQGLPLEQNYASIAAIAQGDVQENIVNGNWTPNAPSTIKRKGSSKPLIDKGRLKQSIVGVVK